jgi:hypothetical protein
VLLIALVDPLLWGTKSGRVQTLVGFSPGALEIFKPRRGHRLSANYCLPRAQPVERSGGPRPT